MANIHQSLLTAALTDALGTNGLIQLADKLKEMGVAPEAFN